MCCSARRTKLFNQSAKENDVAEFIKLFHLDGKISTANNWNEAIINAFTRGYCYNFSKALKIAFHEKYNCTIVGVGTLSVLDYQMCDLNAVKETISNLEFEHYVCQIAHKQNELSVYNCDILGIWPLDEPSDYKVIHIKTQEDKQTLLDVIDHPDKFLETYQCDNHYGWRFMWYFSNKEQMKLEHWFKQTNH